MEINKVVIFARFLVKSVDNKRLYQTGKGFDTAFINSRNLSEKNLSCV